MESSSPAESATPAQAKIQEMPETPAIQPTASMRRLKEDPGVASRWTQAVSSAVAWTRPDAQSGAEGDQKAALPSSTPQEGRGLLFLFKVGRLSISVKDRTPDRGEITLVKVRRLKIGRNWLCSDLEVLFIAAFNWSGC